MLKHLPILITLTEYQHMSIYVPTYLYIKQHSITGLKYFGKTIKKDPVKYLGSGKYWKNHIKKHGKNHIITLWFQLFDDVESLTSFALQFSVENNIVKSQDWANLIPENGLCGVIPGSRQSIETRTKRALALTGKKRITRSPEHCANISASKKGKSPSTKTREKLSIAITGKKRSDETKKKMSLSQKGKKHTQEQILKNSLGHMGKVTSDETKSKLSLIKTGIPQVKLQCPHCNMVGGNVMKRHHFDNCKLRLIAI